jgi:beta-phosphoglucomutase-like phosphatase (HAD superfamily)
MIARFADLDPSSVRVLLCDADGTLFPSEEPAYAASADVVNRLLAELGSDRTYRASELQAITNGKNFRASAQQLAEPYGRELDPAALSRWADEEKDVVTAHLREVLKPDPAVRDTLTQLARRFILSIVTSSAASRVATCLEVTQLSDLFAPERRFSAEDSLPEPTSKPDPAVYVLAGSRQDVAPDEAIALEDSVNGALSAVAAGFPTIGIVTFVPADERAARTVELAEAGVVAVVSEWSELSELLSAQG